MLRGRYALGDHEGKLLRTGDRKPGARPVLRRGQPRPNDNQININLHTHRYNKQQRKKSTALSKESGDRPKLRYYSHRRNLYANKSRPLRGYRLTPLRHAPDALLTADPIPVRHEPAALAVRGSHPGYVRRTDIMRKAPVGEC